MECVIGHVPGLHVRRDGDAIVVHVPMKLRRRDGSTVILTAGPGQ